MDKNERLTRPEKIVFCIFQILLFFILGADFSATLLSFWVHTLSEKIYFIPMKTVTIALLIVLVIRCLVSIYLHKKNRMSSINYEDKPVLFHLTITIPLIAGLIIGFLGSVFA